MAINLAARNACPQVRNGQEGHVHRSAACYCHICPVKSSPADTVFQKTVVWGQSDVRVRHCDQSLSGAVPRNDPSCSDMYDDHLETSTALCSSKNPLRKILYLARAADGDCFGQDGGQPGAHGRKDGHVHCPVDGPICLHRVGTDKGSVHLMPKAVSSQEIRS